MTRQEKLNEISKATFIRVAKSNAGRGVNKNSNRVAYVKIPAGLYRVVSSSPGPGNNVESVTIKGLGRKGEYNGREYTILPLFFYDIAEDLKAAERLKRTQRYKPVTGPSPAHLEVGRLLVEGKLLARELYQDGGKPIIQFLTPVLERDGENVFVLAVKETLIDKLTFCSNIYCGGILPKPMYTYDPNPGGGNEGRYYVDGRREDTERIKKDLRYAVQAYLDQKTAAAKEVLKKAGIND